MQETVALFIYGETFEKFIDWSSLSSGPIVYNFTGLYPIIVISISMFYRVALVIAATEC